MDDGILGLVEGVPWEERSAGGETSRLLAEMIVREAVAKKDRSLTFQAESVNLNRKLFNSSAMEDPNAQMPDQLGEHPQTPPLQPLDQLGAATGPEADMMAEEDAIGDLF